MKLLFVISNLEIGGTRRSLLNLLSFMSDYDVELTLLAFSPYGAYQDMVPEKVKLITGNKLMQSHFASNKILKERKSIGLWMFRLFGAAGKKLFGEDRFWDHILKKFAKKKIKNEYDAIIGFQEGLSDFFTTFTSIRPRLIWLHNDFENIPAYRRRGEEAYTDIDKIFFVAETAKESFSKAFSSLKDRMSVIKNIVPQKEIIEKSKEYLEDDYYIEGKINLISVGRIEPQKAFDRVIDVLDKLGALREQLNWIIIGEGTMREVLEEQIRKKGYEDCVRFIGTKSNPYPYIANSDLFVLTSKYESQPMVIMESLTVGTPVVSTNFTSSYELLENKKYGIICENSEDGIAKSLRDIIQHPEIITSLKKHTSEFVYDNDSIIKQIFEAVSCK